MSAPFCRSRRAWRHELYPVGGLFLITAILILKSPLAVFDFSPASEVVCKPSCAFVALTPAQEEAALARARAAWQSLSGSRSAFADLSLDALPEDERGSVVESVPSVRLDLPRVEFTRPIMPPSEAAPAPKRLSARGASSRPRAGEAGVMRNFSRDEMLKVD